jgi:ABC-type lipoprotein export system ATPase subunit
MKVKSLFIKDYNQFKDFELDLTYPAGHPKAGQPLDKVCIIGQSGTGKTSLLLFLKNIWGFLIQSEFYSKDTTQIRQYIDYLPNEFTVSMIDNKGKNGFIFQSDNHNILDSIGPLKQILRQNTPNILYFSTEVELQTWGATQLTFSDFWFRIAQNIQKYQELEIQKRIELSKIIENTNNQEALQNAKKDFENWRQNNPNPIEDIANQLLDNVLNRFNLQIKRELNFTKKEDIGTIKIETLQGQEVPFYSWSTGTKQLITRVLPLYAMRPKNYLLLFDEPEQSLYPDIQTEIIDVLTNPKLSTDCQFFFATHSPLIASCFEPWEIVELKFNPGGSVYRELYYDVEKGNHVDNYTIDPRYLRWDSILTRLFDLDKDSNEARTRKLMELATLRSKLQKANGKLPSEEKQKLQAQFEKLAELLDWEYDAEN